MKNEGNKVATPILLVVGIVVFVLILLSETT